ncbi:hypothetical protein [Candidiatus Paracoxiella cheracis]|uniref:hypothetical protein n=1 Tax=Candidiatus Paracoxiella cheracis TaxID=3405120 RepID=UPI003BF5C0DB
MTARKDFLQSLTLGKKSEPTAEYAPSLRSPWRASVDGFCLRSAGQWKAFSCAKHYR